MPSLISTPGQIWLSVAPVDLRKGIDGLSALVQQNVGQQPCAGSAFVFRNAPGNRIKILLWDGNGVWLCQRRLHQGHFIWPKSGEDSFSIAQAQWEWLIAGVDSHRAILPDALSGICKSAPGGFVATFIGSAACPFTSLIKDIFEA